MKRLEKLKEDILNDKYEKFYVWYGEDYGIRHHYIDRVSKKFDNVLVLDSCEEVTSRTVSNSLFQMKTLCLIYEDFEFANKDETFIHTFISRLKDYTVILIYETGLFDSNLFKHFEDYITHFSVVQDNIALEFVESEVKLLPSTSRDLASNCKNNYNNILLETDKIKSYSNEKGMSLQTAYEDLEITEQLIREYPDFDSSDFMNYFFEDDEKSIAKWIGAIENKNQQEKFYFSLPSIFNDFIIAGLITKYGKWERRRTLIRFKIKLG